MKIFLQLVALLLFGISASLYSASTETQQLMEPAPLFPELEPHYPLKFSETNAALIASTDLRLTEWNQKKWLPEPSWLAIFSLLATAFLFFLLEKETVIHRKDFARQRIDAKNLSNLYIQIVDASREYLELTFEIPALNQTLEETLKSILKHPLLTNSQKNLLEHAYRRAEPIKFNQIVPEKEECRELLRQFHAQFFNFFNRLEINFPV